MSQGRKRNDRGSKRLIQLGVTGVVKRYIDTGGYGFITEDDTNRDVFFHISAVSKNNRRLGDPVRVGDEVIYDLYLAPKGYRAESVQILHQDLESSDSEDDDSLHRRKKSGSGLGNGRGGGAGNRRGRGRGKRHDGRDRNRRGGSVGRGHDDVDYSDDYESDDGGWGGWGDRMPRSNIRSNGSTWKTRSASQGRKERCQGGQPGTKETRNDSGFFCQYCQCFHVSCKKCANSYQNDNRSENVNAEGTNGSFPTFEASRPASKTRWPGAEPTKPRSTFSFQGTQRVNPDTKSNPQSTSTAGNTYSFFDHLKTPPDTGKGADIKKNPFGNGDSFPRTGASSQGSNAGTRYTTYTKKSDTEKKSPDTKSPDTKPKPQTPSHSYSFSDLYGSKASNSNNAKDDISRNPSRNGASYRTGVSSEGNNKGTQNTTDTKPNMAKSDRKPNPPTWRSSTAYSYSYASGSNRFSVPLMNANNRKESSSLGTGKQMPTNNSRSASGDYESAKPAGDSKDPTKDRGAMDDVESKKKPTTHELPNQQGKRPGGTPASKDKPTTSSGNMPKMDPKTSTSSSLSSVSRETGNMFFRSASDQTSTFLKSFKLKSALACYTKAYDWSNRDEDLVSAAKNAGTTYWRLASLKIASGGASDKKVIHEYFKDALQYFSKAYSKRNCRGQAWVKHLEKSIQDCLDDIITWIAPKDEYDRIDLLKEYLGYLPACSAKVNGYLHIANIYFRSGKEALCFDEYENCEGYLKDCRVPLGEAEKMSANMDPSIRLNVTALKKNVEYHESLVKKCIARAKDVQARQERARAEESEKKIATEQLKADMKKLDLLMKSSIEDFVDQVYRLWPPKGSKGPNPPWSSSSSPSSTASKKKLLIRSISYYHPDKVDKNVHGIKWHLLSGEITKCLTMRLAKIK